MRLTCISSFRAGPVSYEVGQAIDVSDEEGAYLLRCSPSSFRTGGTDRTAEVRKQAPDEPDTSAMSTETQTGITAPDRRARGGAKRTTKKK